MKERGTTGAGKPQITGVPRVHHGHLKRVHRAHGRGTGDGILLGRTSGIRPSIPPAMVHGSMVTDDAKCFQPLMEWISDSTRGGFVSSCPTREWPPREGRENCWSDWKDVRSIRVKEDRTWKHRLVLRICLIT